MRTKLREHESVLFQTRTHWLTVWQAGLLLIVALGFVYLAFVVAGPGSANKALRTASLIVLAAALLFFGYREWYRRRDIWVVTNLRVIDEEGIFTLSSKESPMEKINNISYRQTILGRILNYGEVEIQTAASDGATLYTMITGPKKLEDTIAKARDAYAREMLKASPGSSSAQA
ncbi:MAG: PH domain-containing protein [Acidobacteriota bacterium]|nr:PH domain-containing protein [Acidobacteriota bacterium]